MGATVPTTGGDAIRPFTIDVPAFSAEVRATSRTLR